tara:strand:- start:211 stop:552 length:342 start_codon:yes stop_codon:yes gene_type:complete
MKTFYENTIIDSIDLTEYGFKGEITLHAKLIKVNAIFKKEYGFMIERVRETNAFKEYLMGLPNCITVPFNNYEVIRNAKEYGITFDTEKHEDVFLGRYWNNLALAFFTLKNNL